VEWGQRRWSGAWRECALGRSGLCIFLPGQLYLPILTVADWRRTCRACLRSLLNGVLILCCQPSAAANPLLLPTRHPHPSAPLQENMKGLLAELMEHHWEQLQVGGCLGGDGGRGQRAESAHMEATG